MSSPGNPELNPTQLSGVVESWLLTEITESDNGRNAYLSEFEARKEDLSKRCDDPTNFLASKAYSHHDRQILWVAPYKQDSNRTNDWFTARLIFHPLMQISGGFRKQSIIQAQSADEYADIRNSGQASGIDLEITIEDAWHDPLTKDLEDKDPSDRLTDIIDRTLDVNSRNLALHRLLHPMTPEEHSTIDIDLNPVDAMLETQKMWTGLLVAHIVVAASFREADYTKVPFIEPKSISDASPIPIYPLAA